MSRPPSVSGFGALRSTLLKAYRAVRSLEIFAIVTAKSSDNYYGRSFNGRPNGGSTRLNSLFIIRVLKCNTTEMIALIYPRVQLTCHCR